MSSPATYQTVRVSYCLAVDQITSPEENDYHIHFRLSPGAQALPFEPFLTLLRTEYQDKQASLTELLRQTTLPQRLQQLLLPWLKNQPYPDIEPTNPDEYQFEQNAIRQALYELIHLAFTDRHQKILIDHAEYLPVTSSKLVQDINSSAEAKLIIDLLLTPENLQQWWPEDQIQRQLKHRFLTSGKATSSQFRAQQKIEIGHTLSQLDSQLGWAERLYCGGELKHLLTRISIEHIGADYDEQIRRLCLSVRAAIYLNHTEECARLVSTLNQADWQTCSLEIQNFVYTTRYLANAWFHQFPDAYLVSQEYVDWAGQNASQQQSTYVQLLNFTASCLSGHFSYLPEIHPTFEQSLLDAGWTGLYRYLRSTYWFDHEYLLENRRSLINSCIAALEYAENENNQLAKIRSLHHLSIVYQHCGELDKALQYIEQSIQQSFQINSASRTYHALNGKAHLLIQATRFEEALSAIEQAFALVVEDGNYEQACTTLCNAALLGLFSGHFSSAIKAIDEVFSTLLMRGIPHTRLRSNHELRSIQAMAALFAGDRAFALAIYRVSHPEPARTQEGDLIQQLLGLVQQFDSVNNEAVEREFERLFNEVSAKNNPLLALFVRRVQYQLMISQPEFFSAARLESFVTQATEFAQQHHLSNCVVWFSPSLPKNDPSISDRLAKLNVTKVSQREAQIDLLRIENGLLKISLEVETFASHCDQPEDLFEYCLNKLFKTVSLIFVQLTVRKNQSITYETSVGLVNTKLLQSHQFSFLYDGHEAVFSIQFEEKIEIFSSQLVEWTSRFVDQLNQAVNKTIDRHRSRKLAYIDHLTGLKNRAAFEDFFAQTTLNSGDVLSVGFIDLNRFKQINDQHGHLAGDAILSAFAAHLKHSVRATDLVFRIGGDEFFIVFKQAEAAQVRQTLNTKLMAFFRHQRRQDDAYSALYSQMGCSIGLLQITAQQITRLNQNMIVQRTDALMYLAKQRGVSAIEMDAITV